MKKKLSLLLASLLVMTMIPVSSFAIKTSGDSDAFSVDYEATDVSKYTVKVEMQSDVLATGDYVRFNLENADFAGTDAIKVEKDSKEYTDATVDTSAGSSIGLVTFDDKTAKNDVFYFELSVKTDQSDVGDVNLSLSGDISKDSFKIGTVEESSVNDLSIKVLDKDKRISASGGQLSRFEIKNYDKTTEDIEITIEDDMAAFDATATGTVVDGVDAAKVTITGSKITITDATDAKYIVVTPVFKAERKMELGSVVVEVAQKMGSEVEETTATIGEVVEYNATMKATANGKKEIETVIAGKTSDVKVTVESTKGTLSRNLEFTLDGAEVSYKEKDGDVTGVNSISGGTLVKGTEDKDSSAAADAVGYTSEFEITPTGDKITFIVKAKVNADAPDGVATLTMESRDLDDSVEVDIVNVDKAYEVKTSVTEIKRGESSDTADIVVSETKAGQIGTGDYVRIALNGKSLFNEKPSFEATNGMKFDDVEWYKVDGDTVGVQAKVTTKSKGDPAEITISGAAVDMLNNGIQGRTYTASLYVGAKNGGTEFAEFDYTKCVAEYSRTAAKIVFTLGSANYTVDGVVMTLEAPVFTKDNRTMLPIGPLALAMGLDVNYNADTQTATFRDPFTGQIVSVKENATMLYNNGIEYKMHTAAVTVNGRIFVPVASITDAFGSKIVWDEASQTVTIN